MDMYYNVRLPKLKVWKVIHGNESKDNNEEGISTENVDVSDINTSIITHTSN